VVKIVGVAMTVMCIT